MQGSTASPDVPRNSPRNSPLGTCIIVSTNARLDCKSGVAQLSRLLQLLSTLDSEIGRTSWTSRGYSHPPPTRNERSQSWANHGRSHLKPLRIRAGQIAHTATTILNMYSSMTVYGFADWWISVGTFNWSSNSSLIHASRHFVH